MILTGPQIELAVRSGEIVIRPFHKSQIAPNSYDFRLGNRCCVYTAKVLDSVKENPSRRFEIPAEGMILSPKRLWHTLRPHHSRPVRLTPWHLHRHHI